MEVYPRAAGTPAPIATSLPEPTITPSPVITPTITLYPNLLPTPVPNKSGLVIEENEIVPGSIELDAGKFQPVYGSQQEVLNRHAAQKQARYDFKRLFDAPNWVMLPLPLGQPFRALESSSVGADGLSYITVSIQKDGKEIFQAPAGEVSPLDTLHGLWVDGEHWTLEIAFVKNIRDANLVNSVATGQVYQDGVLLNQKYGYDEMFGYQLLDGKPFYFYKKDGQVHLSYNNQDLPLSYDSVAHYGCCSSAMMNPVSAPNWVGFYGKRGDTWYYVEVVASGSESPVTPEFTSTPEATIPQYTCPESGSSAALAITNTMPIKETTSCLFTSVPIKVYSDQALGGFTLTYPEDWKLSMTDDGQESFDFSGPFSIHVMHTVTDLPLSQIEQSRRVYEFVSLPVFSLQEQVTGRSEVRLGKHSVVVLDTSFGIHAIRRYWVKSAEPNASGQYDLFIFEIDHFEADADAFPARVSAVEALITSLQFSPADTHVIDLSPMIALPTRPVELPIGVLVEGENGTLQAVDLNGQVLGKLNPPGLNGLENFHVVGPFNGDVNQLQLVNMDHIPSANQKVYIYQGESILKRIAAPWVEWVNAAQELPLLAYVAVGTQSQQLFYGKAADFPVKPLEDPMATIAGTGLNPYPYSFYAQDGAAKGLWLTQRPYGIGGFAYSLDSSLTYVDISPAPEASPSRHQVLPDGAMLGLSFDFTYAAYQSVWPDLHILNLQTKKDIAVPMNAGSDGTGSAHFSPDNAWVAWIEKSGYPDTTGTGTATLHSRVRVASQAGEIRLDLQDEQFANAAGFTPNWVEPVGWLDNQTLLVQASEYWNMKPVLLKLSLPGGSLTQFSQGLLIDFLYPEVGGQ